MTSSCCKRPNRTKKRYFTAKDVARISKYAVDDGADVKDLIVRTAKALGLAYLLCIISKALSSVAVLARLIAKIGGVLALAKLIEQLLSFFKSPVIRRIPQLRFIGVLAVILLESFANVLQSVETLVEDATIINAASEFMADLCSRVAELE